MTPEEARKLLDGITPGPWEVEVRSYEEDCYADDAIYFWVTDHNGNEVAEWRTLEPYAREIGGNCTLMAAAPDMAAMIAGMRTEYRMEVCDQHGKWHHGGWTDDPARCFEPSFFGLKITARRLVRRYVTAPQPLGEEQ